MTTTFAPMRISVVGSGPAFLTDLEYRDYDVEQWILTADLVFRTTIVDFLITAKAGEIIDFYSIPRLLRIIYAKNRGKGNAAAVIHDICVRHRAELGLTLMQCHKIFKQAMVVCGLPEQEIRNKYWGVVLFNWILEL